MTRKAVAQRLGISYARVRSLHDKGRIVEAARAADGAFLFAANDVDALAAELEHGTRRRRPRPKTRGEIAARAYELLDAGASERELVVRLRVTPERATELRLRWAGRDAVVIDVRTRRAVELELARQGIELDRWNEQLPEIVAHLCARLEACTCWAP